MARLLVIATTSNDRKDIQVVSEIAEVLGKIVWTQKSVEFLGSTHHALVVR
jgi:hypothetical protein